MGTYRYRILAFFISPHSSHCPVWYTLCGIMRVSESGVGNYHEPSRFPSLPTTLPHKPRKRYYNTLGEGISSVFIWGCKHIGWVLKFISFFCNILWKNWTIFGFGCFTFPFAANGSQWNIWIRICQRIHWRETDQRQYYVILHWLFCSSAMARPLSGWWDDGYAQNDHFSYLCKTPTVQLTRLISAKSQTRA